MRGKLLFCFLVQTQNARNLTNPDAALRPKNIPRAFQDPLLAVRCFVCKVDGICREKELPWSHEACFGKEQAVPSLQVHRMCTLIGALPLESG